MSHVEDLALGATPPSRSRALQRVRTLLLRSGAVAGLGLGLFGAGQALAATDTITGTFTAPTATEANNVQVELVDPNGQPIDSAVVTVSGNTGTYAFSNENANTPYYVVFSDRTAGDNVLSEYYGGTESIATATAVNVAAGATVTLNPTTLTTGGEITGTVADANGTQETALGQSQTVQACTTATVADPLLDCFSATTNATTGAYTIAGVPTGSYVLAYAFAGQGPAGVDWYDYAYYTTSGFTEVYAKASPVSVSQSGSPTTVSFSIPAVQTISGTVTVPGGTPLDDVDVSLFDSFGDAVDGFADTAPNGTYTVAGVLPGSYKVQFTPPAADSPLALQYFGGASTLATASTVTVGSGPVANINAALVQGGTIAGKVTAAQGGAVLGGLEVELVDANGNHVTGTQTRADGTYTLADVPAGRWYVEFEGGLAANNTYYATEYYGGKPTLNGAKSVTVAVDGTQSGVNGVLLAESTSIAGLPKESKGALSGLNKRKVALRFHLVAGSGVAADLKSFKVKLPKGFSWDRKTLKKHLSLGKSVRYSYTIKSGALVVTLASSGRSASLTIKAGGITDTKKIEKSANAKKIKSETIKVSAIDTVGNATPLKFIVKKPK
jgi:carboxypeptidase family protein